jgi:hypothetical protein
MRIYFADLNINIMRLYLDLNEFLVRNPHDTLPVQAHHDQVLR